MDKLQKERLERIEFSERNEQEDPILEVHLRARARMSADSKLTYKQAVHAVYEDDRDLCAAYVATIPPMWAHRE